MSVNVRLSNECGIGAALPYRISSEEEYLSSMPAIQASASTWISALSTLEKAAV